MKNKFLLLAVAILGANSLKAQLNVGSTSAADASAILQATSTTKGFLPPSMTTGQIVLIVNPAKGLTVYDNELNQLKVNVGTPSNPSWAVAAGTANWSQNGNSGTLPDIHYLGTTDNVGLSLRTNGLERVRIDEAGKIGIGTTTPAASLDVTGNMRLGTTIGGATTDSILTINATTGIINTRSVTSVIGQGTDSSVYNSNGTLTGPRIITQAGNTLSLKGGIVQIDSSLYIDAAARFNGVFTNTTGSLLRFGNSSTTGEGIGSKRTSGGNSSGLDLFTNFLPRLSVTNTGFVGIGTQSPLAKLHVEGIDGMNASIILNNTNGTSGRKFSIGSRSDILSGTGVNGTFIIADETANTARMAIDLRGYVGVGTTTPSHKLEVNGTMGILAANALEFGTGVVGKEVNAGKINYNTSSLDINGVGTTSSNRKVTLYDNATVAGTFQVANLPASTSTQIVTTDGSGNLGQRALKPTVFGVGNQNSVNGISLNSSTTTPLYTGWTITIPAQSKYQVYVAMLFQLNTSYTTNSVLVTNGLLSTTQPTFTDFSAAGYGVGFGSTVNGTANVLNSFQPMSGTFFVNNTSASSLTLYYFMNSSTNTNYNGSVSVGAQASSTNQNMLIGTPVY